MDGPVRLAIVGGGSRGETYGDQATARGQAQVVAVADPRPARRERLALRYGLDDSACFADWRHLAARTGLADAVVVATPDRLHTAPTIAFAEQGCHVLLEKPMAPSLTECEAIAAAAERAGVVLAVCHVLRYTSYTRTLKRILDDGAVGDVVSVEHLEPVGWWHFAHSYVRGNWRRADESNPVLLAKSCHDIDWLGHVIGRRARRVTSFGGLHHFRRDRQPEGAADRCVDCGIEPTCPYSAPRLYFRALDRWNPERDPGGWPLTVIADEVSQAGVEQALRLGPYGRCVYACDNDVVDHQVVSLEYDEGVTASFTMTAFTPQEDRKTRIFGTHGFVEGDGERLRIVDFRTGADETRPAGGEGGPNAAEGHGGGDRGLVDAFLHAVITGDPAAVVTGPRESMESHRIVWAAETARRTGTVVSLDQPTAAAGATGAAEAVP